MKKIDGYYRLNKSLLSDVYPDLSLRGAVLAAAINDRAGLSAKNASRWTDENGEIYLFFTNAEACKLLKCSHDTATKTFAELERHKIIHRESQGQGNPHRVYMRLIRTEIPNNQQP